MKVEFCSGELPSAVSHLINAHDYSQDEYIILAFFTTILSSIST
jgi:hypothetical protein